MTCGPLIVVILAVVSMQCDVGHGSTKPNASKYHINQRLCQSHSRYVYCSHMGGWFTLGMISRSAVVINLNNNQLTSLDPIIMKKFKYLVYLEVNHNNIETFSGSFTKNRNLIRLAADDNKLGRRTGPHQAALKGAFMGNKKLQSASLRQNGIRKLSSKMVDENRNEMRNLDLAENKIEKVTRHTVAAMPRLERLDFHDNNIMFLHGSAFRKNRKLRYLDLGGNRIAFVGNNRKLDLSNNKQLVVLLLSNNKLSSMREVYISKNKNLESLDISLNRIRWLGGNNLVHNSKLLKLNASNNYIHSVHPSSLLFQKNLHTLDLSRNRITRLRPFTLQNLKNLQVLSLAYNLLKHLNKNMFIGNGRLVVIDLRGNKLGSWQPAFFYSNVHLRSLDLRDNQLRVNESNFFNPLFYEIEVVGSSHGARNDRSVAPTKTNEGSSPEDVEIDLTRTRRVLQRLRCLRISTMQPTEGKVKTQESTFEIGEKHCNTVDTEGDRTWICGCAKRKSSSDSSWYS